MTAEVLPMWKRVFRDGLCPLLSTEALEVLRKAVRDNSPELIQQETTTPPALECVRDWPCEAACLIAYPFWKTEGLSTVEEVETRWAQICFQIDERMSELAACRWIMNHWDETPRRDVFRMLEEEIDLELQRRKEAQATPNN